MHNPRCMGEDWQCKSFYSLDVEKIETIDTRLRAQAARMYVVNPPGSPSTALTTVDPSRMADYNIYLGGGADVFLWTTATPWMLRAPPPTGVTLAPAEARTAQGGVSRDPEPPRARRRRDRTTASSTSTFASAR